MKTAAIVTAVLLFLLVCFAVWCCVALSGRISRQEEKEKATAPGEPVGSCDECLRWSECNGVDPDCPLRKEEAHGEG